MAESSNSSTCHFITRNPPVTYTFRWTLENFEQIASGKVLRSPKFTPHPCNQNYWSVTLMKLKEDIGEDVPVTALCFKFVDTGCPRPMSAPDYTLNVVFELCKPSGDTIPISNFLKINDFMYAFAVNRTVSGASSNLLRNDALVLICKMEFGGVNLYHVSYNPSKATTDI